VAICEQVLMRAKKQLKAIQAQELTLGSGGDDEV
jgi:hypothetical protein